MQSSYPFVYQYSHYSSSWCDTGVTLNVTPPALTNVTNTWASHGTDLFPLFGNGGGPNPITYDRMNCPQTQSEDDLSNTMMLFWTNFAKTGNPNGDNKVYFNREGRYNLPFWSPFCDSSNQVECERHVMKLSTVEEGGVVLRNQFKTSDCEFWDSIRSLLMR